MILDNGGGEYCVIGIDPGVTNGVALVRGNLEWGAKDSRWVMVGLEVGPGRGLSGELDCAHRVFDLVLQGAPDMVCIEDFVLRNGRTGVSTDRDALAPVRMIAMLYTLFADSDLLKDWRLVFQSAASAKGTITDERLKATNGGWIKGKPHARDAMRHALLGMRSVRQEARKRAS